MPDRRVGLDPFLHVDATIPHMRVSAGARPANLFSTDPCAWDAVCRLGLLALTHARVPRRSCKWRRVRRCSPSRARTRYTRSGIPPRHPRSTLHSGVVIRTVRAAYANMHPQVSMCQAKLVGPLITLTHSDVENVSDAGGNVLKLLA